MLQNIHVNSQFREKRQVILEKNDLSIVLAAANLRNDAFKKNTSTLQSIKAKIYKSNIMSHPLSINHAIRIALIVYKNKRILEIKNQS